MTVSSVLDERRAALVALVVVLAIYGTIIIGSLGRPDPGDRAEAWLLVGVLLVGTAGIAVSRFHAAGVARGLTLMAASQIAAGLVMFWQGFGAPWRVTVESLVLALVVATLAWAVRRAARDDD